MDDQVFFDFDGTIVDSERGIVAAVKKWSRYAAATANGCSVSAIYGPTLTVSLKRFPDLVSRAGDRCR